MSAINATSRHVYQFGSFSIAKEKCKKVTKIALAILMAISMIVSFSVGAPWVVTFAFFALTLVPLFRLNKRN